MVFDSQDVGDFLAAVMRGFMHRIDGDRRGISWAATVFRRGVAHTIAAGSDTARAAEKEQCSFENGPVLEALRSGDFVHLADVAHDRRWPGYASAAADHGVRSLLSIPVVATAGSCSAISLYATAPNAFTSDDIVRVRAYAEYVAKALWMVLKVAERAEAQVELALEQRSGVLVDLPLATLIPDYGPGPVTGEYFRSRRQDGHGPYKTGSTA
ncbi:MAG TPA: GAF domain-containing protein [Arthrobacter sp.]|nr:GAF domain-containing protein [Arthrobacter sp.]